MLKKHLNQQGNLVKKYLIVILFCLVGFLSACGAKSTTVTITPVGNEMKYEVTRFEVKAGQKVTIIMKNTATVDVMKHNVVILNDKDKVTEVGLAAITAEGNLPNHSAIIAATAIAGPGEQTTVTFTAPKNPGEYTYICTYPGHYAMMQGVMVVK